ncbi:MAG: T9SS type A sorting domain-containing protein, partial [bacterium]
NNESVIGIPVYFELSQNYPNPFNPSTRIDYQLAKDGNVRISVFDNSGKEVMTLVNEFKTAGYYTANLIASTLPSGVYFYKISSDNFSSVKKMILLK